MIVSDFLDDPYLDKISAMAGSLSRMASWPAPAGMLFLIALLFSVPQHAEAHSGGLNSQGCHAGSQPYHCHRPQGQAGTGSTGSTSSSGQRRVISGVITSVRDGDTFLLGNLPIRLAAVDCPETNTQSGRRAAQFLRQYTSSRVTCELTGATTYDRSVAYCSIDGRDIGRLLFANTQCRVWERYDVWNRY
jgi:endonuclease YncB( thermonuclease family)